MITMETKLEQIQRMMEQDRELHDVLRRYHPELIQKLDGENTIFDLGHRKAYNTMISLTLMLRMRDAGNQILYDLDSKADVLAFTLNPGGPCAIVVPAGDYREMRPFDSAGIPIAFELDKLGINTFVLCNRIGEEAKMPAPLEDLVEAVKLIFAKADAMQTAPENYVLFGFSSGGHLAGLFAAKCNGYNIPAPAATVYAFAPLSMTFLEQMLQEKMASGKSLQKTEEVFKTLLGSDWTHNQILQMSVPEQVSGNYPPTYLIHGELDTRVYIRHSELMEQALETKGVRHVFRSVPDAEHEFGKGFNTAADGWLSDAVDFWRVSK